MPKHGTTSIVPGSFVEFGCAVLRNLPRDLDPEVMVSWTNNGESLSRILREALCPEAEEENPASKTEDKKSICDEPAFQASAELYHKLFGKIPDFSGLAIPQAPDDGKYIAVVVAKELVEWTDGSPKEGLFHARKKLFPTWKYDNDSLNAVIPMDNDQRDMRKGSYVVLLRDSETPDQDLMNLSANQIVKMNITTSTDTEYALFSGIFFLKHGYHPDRKTWTLNSGSRDHDGDVPNGNWNDSKSNVNWYNPTNHSPNLGSRSFYKSSLCREFLFTYLPQPVVSLEIS